ncbi:MAG: 50S ribosomal protein L1 [Candidatus Bathyarchaeota archaeon]|nr:MAG: 50S ribosomal protein L1 [Candidatus Bathyarchaeota archaeon]
MPIDKKTIINAVIDAKKNTQKRNFNQSIDLIINLIGIDLKKPENRINELIELPYPPRKKTEIVVFANSEIALRAKDAGVEEVIGKEELDRLSNDKKSAKNLVRKTDYFIAEASLMPLVGRVFGPILGPRGKMPTPTPPTADINSVVKKHRRMTRVRVRDQLNSQCNVGTEDMPDNYVAENIQTIITRLEETLPKGSKNIGNVFVKTTMGPLTKIR